MSERGAYQLPDGTLVRTQGEIPKGVKAEKVMIPVDSQGLIVYINGIIARERSASPLPSEPAAETPTIATNPEQMRPSQMERFEAVARRLGWTPPGEAQAPAPAPRRDVSSEIMELTPNDLAPVLSAAIGRLGEVAQHHGWAVFGKSVYQWTPGSKSVEQGLGMLMLAAMEQIGAKNEKSDQSSA